MLSLTRQLIIQLILFVCLTASLIAGASYYLLTASLEQQIQARLVLGTQHTRALWQLFDLQMRQTLELLAQRPTLARLLVDPDAQQLDQYLAIFQADTDFDFLYLRDRAENYIAGSIPASSDALYLWQHGLDHDLVIEAGIYLDDALLTHLGQDNNLIYQYPTRRPIPADYRGTTIELGREFEVMMLFSIEDMLANQRFALVLIAGVTVLTVGIASTLGGLFIRRRIHPLWRLKDSAKRMGEGDLQTPIIALHAFSPDMAILRETLESSRQRIARSLQEIAEQRDWANRLMQSIIEGIVTFDHDGQIVFHSDSTAQIMQWRKSKVGREVDKVFICHDDNRQFRACLPAEGRSQTINLMLDNGGSITALVTRARTLPGGETSIVLRDITEETRKRKAQAYYLANMSHEFRTPLSGMKASLELLMENLGNLSKAEETQLLNSIVLSVSSLQSLIDNLLEGSKLEAQQFTLRRQHITLDIVLIDAIRTMRPLLTRRQQALEIAETETPIQLWVDKTRMVQVLVNLLSNASKYSPQNSLIEILIEQRDRHLWLGVADRGEGVPEAQREQIFNAFVRLETQAEADHSTGLGLAVVRGIVEAHSGSVGVTAREGGGSIFWLQIPLGENDL